MQAIPILKEKKPLLSVQGMTAPVVRLGNNSFIF